MKRVYLFLNCFVLILFASVFAHAELNGPGTPITISANTLCNNGVIEKRFTVCAGAWSAGALGGGGGSNPTSVANLFSDDFESGTMNNNAAPDVALNTINFRWGNNNSTSVVTMEPDCGGLVSGDPTAVWNNGAICGGPQSPAGGGGWHAKNGDHSLRFRYGAGSYNSEQYWSSNLVTDLWIRYWVRIPVNSNHGTLNNKFLSTFSVTHDDAGEITWQTRKSGSTINLLVQDGGVAVGEALSVALYDEATDKGRWMQMVFRRKAPTSAGANDGILQAYRRWSDESNFTLLQEKLNASAYRSGAVGCGGGFLLGWANDAYASDTEWLIDDVEFSSGSLL